jgi:hypothetical protein
VGSSWDVFNVLIVDDWFSTEGPIYAEKLPNLPDFIKAGVRNG